MLTTCYAALTAIRWEKCESESECTVILQSIDTICPILSKSAWGGEYVVS